jgi:16S rRNA (guanine527-N7)-methyltransferase
MLEVLQEGTRKLLGLELNQEQLEKFQLYYEELTAWNERVNLTAITEYTAVQSRHFLDSLALAGPDLRGDPPGQSFEMTQASLIDIGAGGGFPGLPLKILYPKLKLTLVDSVGKKTGFLEQISNHLGFSDVMIVNSRAEELGQSSEHREKYHFATGRAVASWPVLAEYCLPLCRVGGLFIAPKKGDLSAELKASEAVARLLGGRVRETPGFYLPGDAEAPENLRRLVVTQKIKRTPGIYPRRTGLPSKEPLG